MSHTCWHVLGLDRGSDASTIKRRYAQLLKVTRPEDDPQAFQRLRDAYEAALGLSRSGSRAPGKPVVAAQVEPAPALELSHRTWLLQVFSTLALEQLDAHLAVARERDCQAMFELRLLQHCLAAGDETADVVEWALAELHWLSPWQSLVLPERQIDQLAVQLLQQRIAALADVLASGDEASALQGVTALWRSRWLESLDRRAAAKEALVTWLATDENRTPALVEHVFALLNVGIGEANDYRQGWAWQYLLSYRAAQKLLLRLRGQLAMIWPLREEEQAAWLLLKDMSPGDARRLTDNATPRLWQACDQLERQLRNEAADIVPTLRAKGLQAWRKWMASAGGRWLGLGLFLVIFFATAFPGIKAFIAGAPLSREFGGDLLTTVAVGLIGMQLAKWCGSALNHLARHFAVQDASLSTRLLPRFMASGGAGFLLLRHGVPCLLLGFLCGAWAGDPGAYSFGYGVAVVVSSMLYALMNLRQPDWANNWWVQYVEDLWEHNRAALGWAALIVAFVVATSMRSQQMNSTAQNHCSNPQGEWVATCKRLSTQAGD